VRVEEGDHDVIRATMTQAPGGYQQRSLSKEKTKCCPFFSTINVQSSGFKVKMPEIPAYWYNGV
jgi:hypothetical protein